MMKAVNVADVVISRADRYHPNFDELVMSMLRAKYEKKCFKGAYIESVLSLERQLPEFAITKTSLNGDMLGSVYFHAQVVKYEIYDPIVCVVGADISQDGIKLMCCENANAHIYMENVPADLRVEKGMKIVVRRGESIIYPEGHSHIRTSAMPLCRMNDIAPPRCAFSMTLTRDDVELAKAKHTEIIAPLPAIVAELSKCETFEFFFNMMRDDAKGHKEFDILSLNRQKKKQTCLRYSGKFHGPQLVLEEHERGTPVLGVDMLLYMFVEHAKNVRLLELLCANFPTMADVKKSGPVWKYYGK